MAEESIGAIQWPCACIRERACRAQAELRKEAAASAIEEQLKDKEATEADNAANLAKLAEHEALVRTPRPCRCAEVSHCHWCCSCYQ